MRLWNGAAVMGVSGFLAHLSGVDVALVVLALVAWVVALTLGGRA